MRHFYEGKPSLQSGTPLRNFCKLVVLHQDSQNVEELTDEKQAGRKRPRPAHPGVLGAILLSGWITYTNYGSGGCVGTLPALTSSSFCPDGARLWGKAEKAVAFAGPSVGFVFRGVLEKKIAFVSVH